MTTLGLSIFSIGSELWTIKSSDRQRISAVEMCCWRRMLDDLRIIDLLSTIYRWRILACFGHIREYENWIVQGKVVGIVVGRSD